jgi:MFS family permease
MAAASVPREKMANAIGAVQTAQRIGPTIGPVVGGVLAGAVGHRHAFLVAAAVYAFALVLLSVMYTEPRHEMAHAEAPVRVTFRDILAFENFLVALALILCVQLVERSFEPVLPLYLGLLGFSAGRVPILAGVLFSALALAGALGHQLAATMLRRGSARQVIALSMLWSAVGLSIFAAVGSTAGLVAGMALVGLGIGTASTAAYSAAGSVIPRHAHGASFGLLTGASLLGMSFGPMMGGLVAARSIRAVYVTGVVAFGVLAVTVRRVMVVR